MAPRRQFIFSVLITVVTNYLDLEKYMTYLISKLLLIDIANFLGYFN